VNYELDVGKKKMMVVHVNKRVLRDVVVAEDVNKEDTRMGVLTEKSFCYVEAM